MGTPTTDQVILDIQTFATEYSKIMDNIVINANAVAEIEGLPLEKEAAIKFCNLVIAKANQKSNEALKRSLDATDRVNAFINMGMLVMIIDETLAIIHLMKFVIMDDSSGIQVILEVINLIPKAAHVDYLNQVAREILQKIEAIRPVLTIEMLKRLHSKGTQHQNWCNSVS